MAFRRRACYVCGQVGHLAENCSSTERLCFNCGQGGHESSACSEPRTADQKSCYHCLGKGHIKADCPDLASRPPRTPATVANAGSGPRADMTSTTQANGAAAAPSSTGCYTCGGPHIARNCPQAAHKGAPANANAGVVCRACGGQNHFARDCKAARTNNNGGAPRSAKPKACFRCSETDHLARECPNFPDATAPQNVALVS